MKRLKKKKWYDCNDRSVAVTMWTTLWKYYVRGVWRNKKKNDLTAFTSACFHGCRALQRQVLPGTCSILARRGGLSDVVIAVCVVMFFNESVGWELTETTVSILVEALWFLETKPAQVRVLAVFKEMPTACCTSVLSCVCVCMCLVWGLECAKHRQAWSG